MTLAGVSPFTGMLFGQFAPSFLENIAFSLYCSLVNQSNVSSTTELLLKEGEQLAKTTFFSLSNWTTRTGNICRGP